jgi:hypothetical protein
VRHAFLLVLSVIVASLAGCGPDDGLGNIKLVDVRGTVLVDGKPQRGITVQFTPDPTNRPSTPSDGNATDEQGMYVATFRGKTGLSAGKYQVTVTKPAPEISVPGFEDDPNMGRRALEAARQAGRIPKGMTSLPPDEKIEATFKSEVPSQGGPLNFELKSSSKNAPAKAS